MDKLSLALDYDRKDLKNAWSAFVVAAESSLTKNGILSFIVPYEIMNVAYGQKLQRTIFSKFKRVDIYIPDEKAFKNIDQDAVLFIAQKETSEDFGVFAHRVSSLSELGSLSFGRIEVTKPDSLSIDLKSFLLDKRTIKLLHKIKGSAKQLMIHVQVLRELLLVQMTFLFRRKKTLINMDCVVSLKKY